MNLENPYETPKAEFAFEDPKAPQGRAPRTLMWILFSFQGRIPRRTYWGVSLVTAAVFYGMIFGLVFALGEESPAVDISALVLYVPVAWISLAIQVKRWHDLNKSGWWFCIGFIPFIGPIWVFAEAGCVRGTVGPNNYGPDPT